jgi:hypothetical protein
MFRSHGVTMILEEIGLGTISFEGQWRQWGLRGGEQGARDARHRIHCLLWGMVADIIDASPIGGGASMLPQQTRGVPREVAPGRVATRGGGARRQAKRQLTKQEGHNERSRHDE